MKEIISDDLKNAISNLTDKEKDKLIFRLLKKDLLLAEKLKFELVGTNSVDEEREELKEKLNKTFQVYFAEIHNCGLMLMELREMSSAITKHVKITKDKVGEIALNCFIIKNTLELKQSKILSSSYNNSYTLCIYIISKMFKILILIQKQHEDLQLEFKADVKAIGKLIGNLPPVIRIAINNGFDVNWLLQYNLSENFEVIYKRLREQGFLR